MTLDHERFNAINCTREFMTRLLDRNIPIPKTSELRERAYRLLKHYPDEQFIKEIGKIYFESMEKVSEKKPVGRYSKIYQPVRKRIQDKRGAWR